MNININGLVNVFQMMNKLKEAKGAENTKSAETIFKAETQVKTAITSLNQNILIKQANAKPLIPMNNIQMNMLLKDLIGVPKDLKDFLMNSLQSTNQNQSLIKNLIANPTSQNALVNLLKSNPQVDIAQIAQLLNTNSGNLSTKFIKFLQTNGADQSTINQMKEALMLGASVSVASPSQNETIKNILQLYVPYLPLNAEKEKIEDFEDEFGGASAGDNEILFYITTENIGDFKVSILIDETCEIYIYNIIKKSKDKISELIKSKIKAGVKTLPIEISINMKIKEDEDKKEIGKRNVSIINSTNDMIGIMTIQLVTSAIFEADEKTKVLTKRENKLKN